MNEPESRRKRYCLICHLFKPERCHHCSTCKRCVLGMDHHCPWLATCIGYFNRRLFMNVLIWTIVTVITTLGFNVPYLIKVIRFYADATVR